MKKIGIVYLIVAAMIACDPGSPPSKKTSSNKTPSGERLYKTYCVSCHGSDGSLAFNGAKDLNTSLMPEDERILLIRNGRNLMTAFKGILSNAEIKAVANYTMKFKTEE